MGIVDDDDEDEAPGAASAIDGGWNENGDSYVPPGPVGDVGGSPPS